MSAHLRQLFVAHCGSWFAAWWDVPPPPIVGGRAPRHRAPDVWHDRVVGTTTSVIRDFVTAKILPADHALRMVDMAWARRGAETAIAGRRRKRAPKPEDTSVGIPIPADVEELGRRVGAWRT